MILSAASPETAGKVLIAASLVAAGAYLAAAITAKKADTASPRLRLVLLLAWLAQAVALTVDIAGVGLPVPGARFGFAPSLSATVWLVLAVLLALIFPGESRPLAASPWAPLHWVLGLASYGLFGVAVLHAVLLNRAERQMRAHKPSTLSVTPGMPLLRLERLTFQFVAAGVVVLSLAIALGWWFTPHWRWDHKNLLAVLGWVVLSGLLAGRRVFGWRGRLATRWLYFGAVLLLLSYAGSRFVLEVILQRPPVS